MITHQVTLHFNTVTLIDSQVNRNKDSNRRKKVKITAPVHVPSISTA